MAAVDEAIEILGQDSEAALTVDFYRLKGDLVLALSPDRALEAESWLQRALQVAQKLQLPTLELRAAIRLSRLWRDQGRTEQGRRLLNVAYARFTEGFITADLMEARDLLGARHKE